MHQNYPYLRDPRALAEIRKHKWIESQKAGREIGFATAAVEWIKKYGPAWQKAHLAAANDQSMFMERRKFRRFRLDCRMNLLKNDSVVTAEGIDINCFGLTCRAGDFIGKGSLISVNLPIKCNDKESLFCEGTVERVLPADSRRYEMFMNFNEQTKDKLANCSHFKSQLG